MSDCQKSDLVKMKWMNFLFWKFPILPIVVAPFISQGTATTVTWIVCFSFMGVGCLLNAYRCGRVHCHFTGPLLLLGALASALHGTRVLYLGDNGWIVIAAVVFPLSFGLTVFPEKLWGQYRNRSKNEV